MDSLLALTGFAIAASATPGPNTLMVSAAAARSGLLPVMPHMLGITLGFPAMLVAIAAGLGWPFQELPWLHGVMQAIGTAWLLYLAWKIAAAPPPGDGPVAPPLGFWGAVAFQWVNPKAWLIALAAVPAFTLADAPLLPQALMMAVVFALVSLPCLLLWAGVGLGARGFLGTPGRIAWFNRAMAALLVLSLLPALLERGPL